MRKLNVAKIGVLLLCILLALPMLTGCANELREQKDEEENKQEQLEQIKRKWNEVIHNKTNDVKKIEISVYEEKPNYSSQIQTTTIVEIEDAEQIASIIGILSSHEATIENSQGEQGDDTYPNSRTGMEVIAIAFYGDQEQRKLKLKLYEDSVGGIFEPGLYYGQEVWISSYRVIYEEQIFESLLEIYEAIE